VDDMKECQSCLDQVFITGATLACCDKCKAKEGESKCGVCDKRIPKNKKWCSLGCLALSTNKEDKDE